MLVSALKKFLDRFRDKPTAGLNTAQRLLQEWLPKPDREAYVPRRPHHWRLVEQTMEPHITREGKQVFRRLKGSAKIVPVFLKRAIFVQGSKVYPYSSTRQNRRLWREFDRAVERRGAAA